MLDRPYVVLDFETTGLGRRDRIIEMAALRIEGDSAREFHTLCDPGVALPPFISGLTGLTDADLVGAPSTTDAIRRLMAELLYDDPVLVAHNASFDRRFLDQELALAKLPPCQGPVLCTMQLSRLLFPGLRNHKLASLVEHWQIPCDRHHRALDDVLVTAQLFHLLLRAAGEAGVDPWTGKRATG